MTKAFDPTVLAVSFANGAPSLASADAPSPYLERMHDGRMVRGVILELVPRELPRRLGSKRGAAAPLLMA